MTDSNQNGHMTTPAYWGGRPEFAAPFRFIAPTLPAFEAVLADYTAAYASGLITNAGLVQRFEAAAAERLGVAHCVAVSSCTSGLILVLGALDLRGEVIVPSFTFFATGHALLWNRLTPVFADCEADTWTINPAEVRRCISGNTTAILAVHLYGNPCDVPALEQLAAGNGLKLIFDAAHGFGSTLGGRPVGQFGDAEVFSLSPTKNLIAGEGGLIATNDAVLARRLRAARNYGDPGTYDCEMLGLNARMSEFHAALALAGISLVDEKVRRHNAIASMYHELLSGIEGLSFQRVRDHSVSTYKDYSVIIDTAACGISRDALADALRAENIETKKYFYPPLHRQRLYRRSVAPDAALPQSDRLSDGVLSLPIYHGLTDDSVRSTAKTIRNIIEYCRSQAAQRGMVQHAATNR